MPKRIYVGNLPLNSTAEELRELFEQHGSVLSVSLATHRETGQPRGFGFVEMEEDRAEAAIDALDGLIFGGRNIKVNEARSSGDRPRGGRGSFGSGGRW